MNHRFEDRNREILLPCDVQQSYHPIVSLQHHSLQRSSRIPSIFLCNLTNSISSIIPFSFLGSCVPLNAVTSFPTGLTKSDLVPKKGTPRLRSLAFISLTICI